MTYFIASDLDETLLNSERHVSQVNQSAIAEAVAQGNYFVPTTGRSYFSIDQTLKEIDGYQDDFYMIGMNGSVIVETKTGDIIREQPLSFEIVDALFNFGKKYNVSTHVHTFNDTFVFNMSLDEKKYMSTVPHTEVEDDNIAFLKDKTLYKILFENLDKQYLVDMKNSLPDEIKKQVEITFSSNRYMEFNAKNVTKGNSILYLAEYLGIPKENTIAIGDNNNDLSMIKTAQNGVAVANAIPEIKDNAQLVTETDNNNGAVAEAIEKLVLK